MIYEFVGFESYESACKADIGLLGFTPADTQDWLKLPLWNVRRAIEDGVLDLVRIVNLDTSVMLLVPLCSIQSFRFPYEMLTYRPFIKRRLRSWQRMMLEADICRGAWPGGLSPPFKLPLASCKVINSKPCAMLS